MPHAPAPTRPAWVLAMLGGLLASANAADEPASTAFFETKIRPVLVEHCAKCHGAAIAAPKGGLRVDTRDDVRRGGDSGPGVVPGKPDESLLLQAIERTGDVAPMPPKTKLPAAVVADFRAWIAHGAIDPRTPDAAKPAPATADADWWSLRPLTRPEIPNAGRDAGRNPIDAFLRVRLDAKGLKPVAEADRRTLIRRVTHDLTGLPPTPDEVAAFVADADPTAYERLVDRLLASPRYGERWARHWLDVIHFADTHGLEHDQLRPNAWRYRDYVIASFNRDVPWDRFIREQIAADALYPDQPSLTAALGFLGAGPYDRSAAGTAPKNFEYLDRDDLVTQTMSAFVSTTVNCARCHAHKFDPIPQEDYFALQAVFAGVGKGDVAYDADLETGRRRRLLKTFLAASWAGRAISAPAAFVLGAVGTAAFTRLPVPLQVYAASSSAENERGIVAITTPRVIRVLRRGDLDAPGPEAAPGALSAVSSLKGRFDQVARDDEAGRRVALAEWLADDRNPLTWRSIANRVWQYHFGRGLSDAPGDFGRMGDPPSHPELLDWLAVELRDGGSMKRLHRLICTSAAYRRASVHRDDAEAVDPGDRLVWRMSRRRLEAEEFRDAVLAVSGRLDHQPGGPGSAQFKTLPGIQVTPKLDYETFDWDAPGATRRSIYRIVWRGMPDPLFDALDFPDATLMTPVRGFSASPLQALALLNNPFVLRFSAHFAARVEAVGKSTDDHVRAAFRLALLREPSTDELAAFGKLADAHSLAAVCRLLFNSNEFLFVD
ncbi:PSD1 and planctomycete cytochrome C domain-containing protein [Paludisphaera borealis]|uniref:Cytochrome c domain-containing protein n=1 Tax=Paludisphaera borealis TaxID=1387353 RepID=A0A1U7CK14_9BACT|nr:PSD1 and planctomycete cytochrome C domain-containing protein [Paludisphaera borealis]APW59272.1 hypothetical protein BSF38_00688 [Paludisphaera borealis]